MKFKVAHHHNHTDVYAIIKNNEICLGVYDLIDNYGLTHLNVCKKLKSYNYVMLENCDVFTFEKEEDAIAAMEWIQSLDILYKLKG
jgi:hypothetical protein